MIEVVLVVLLYVSSPKGPVLAPGQSEWRSDAAGRPYNAQTCHSAAVARVKALRASDRLMLRRGLYGSNTYSVFCLGVE